MSPPAHEAGPAGPASTIDTLASDLDPLHGSEEATFGRASCRGARRGQR